MKNKKSNVSQKVSLMSMLIATSVSASAAWGDQNLKSGLNDSYEETLGCAVGQFGHETDITSLTLIIQKRKGDSMDAKNYSIYSRSASKRFFGDEKGHVLHFSPSKDIPYFAAGGALVYDVTTQDQTTVNLRQVMIYSNHLGPRQEDPFYITLFLRSDEQTLRLAECTPVLILQK